MKKLLPILLFTAACSPNPAPPVDDLGFDADVTDTTDVGPRVDLDAQPRDVSGDRDATDARDVADTSDAASPTARVRLAFAHVGIVVLARFEFDTVEGPVQEDLDLSKISNEHVVDPSEFTIRTDHPDVPGTYSPTLAPSQLNTLFFVGTTLSDLVPAAPPNDVTPRWVVVPGERTDGSPFSKDVAVLNGVVDAPPLVGLWLDDELVPSSDALAFGAATGFSTVPGRTQLGRAEWGGGHTEHFVVPSELGDTSSVIRLVGFTQRENAQDWVPFGVLPDALTSGGERVLLRPPTNVQVINTSSTPLTIDYTEAWQLTADLGSRDVTPLVFGPLGTSGVTVTSGGNTGSLMALDFGEYGEYTAVVAYVLGGDRRVKTGRVGQRGEISLDNRFVTFFNATDTPVDVTLDGESETVPAESFSSIFSGLPITPTLVLPTGTGQTLDLSNTGGQRLTLVIDENNNGYRGLLAHPDGKKQELVPAQ